jgi:hypothetical protein
MGNTVRRRDNTCWNNTNSREDIEFYGIPLICWHTSTNRLTAQYIYFDGFTSPPTIYIYSVGFIPPPTIISTIISIWMDVPISKTIVTILTRRYTILQKQCFHTSNTEYMISEWFQSYVGPVLSQADIRRILKKFKSDVFFLRRNVKATCVKWGESPKNQ